MRSFLRKRWFVVAAVLVVLAASSAFLMASGTKPADPSVEARAAKGEFVVTVLTSGELRARQFVQITAPANAQQAGAYQMRIQSIVPEGTVVKAGDVVAEIDRSTLATRMTEVTLATQKADAQMEQAQLDSALTLSTAREAIRTLELGLEEKRLAKEQAVYEAPTVRRQTEIDFERGTRALAQSRMDYQTRTEQAQAKMREVGAEVARQHNLLRVVQEVMQNFTIRAPSPGMVIYVKEWNGRKRTTGSQVSSWDNAVATLPDLSQMESVTYVNEIDIRKIQVGQPVTMTLDSDPDKKLTGRVASVANVGEQRPNSDAKVFEVKVTVLETDTTLRPGMTTGNAIETMRIPDVISVPLEAVNSNDTTSFVYLASGGQPVKQEIVTGAMNDGAVVILHGVREGDRVLLSPPPNPGTLRMNVLPDSLKPAPVADSAAPASAPAPSPAPVPARRDTGGVRAARPAPAVTSPTPAARPH
jgi:RND family efflux transporter MFP subunit